jgi:hypothetical protein
MIKQIFALILSCGVAISIFGANTNLNTEIRSAVVALDGKANYSWTSTPKPEGGSLNSPLGPTEGKTERNGLTYFKLSVGLNTVEAAFRGRKSAIKTESEWESSADLHGERAWVARRLSTFKPPAAEALDLLAKAQGLKKDKGGLYTGDLTQAGVKELLALRSRETQVTAPTGAKGWVKFWTKNELLIRYQYNIQGKLAGLNQQPTDLNLTTTVEIKDIGSTIVQVPEEAKKKL